ncbi:DUF4190 domain-containing protein [Plantibacter sp. VKM Ac-2880]|uniref:DUF4190 domain-containing protein n=1 Tax=Plantibacter sp. VKM Ac-2880 TaxID=2783827 RepID=UPI00188E3E64|nr:DUF4190 domain-containing protein [Plantibacter sp. VKM Ac-2880]MBF4568386.1 DUF4190 domain-containing protein [Plantibacter sp. VKM Ac-2880]
MDEQQHPEGRPAQQNGAPGQQPPQQQSGQPEHGGRPSQGQQYPTAQQQPSQQPDQQAPQQQPYQDPSQQQWSQAGQQGYGVPPATDWRAGAPAAPSGRPGQQTAPSTWQGEQSTYLQTVPTAVYQAPSQGGYAAYQQQPSSVGAAAASTSTARSTWSLISGIVGLVVSVFVGWGFPLSIVAIVLGFGARRREPGARGRALTGLVTGFVGLACSIGWLVYSVVVIVGYVST